METKVFKTIQKYHMLSSQDSILVALSGGADSMALLYFLYKNCSNKLYAAHINHNLRGEESNRDEEFVKNICKNFGIEFFVLNADVKKEAELKGFSIEQAARSTRYDFLEKTAKKLNARIATAHTLSDNMETVLFNLVRGTGLKGICGIPPVRNNIIRPLLECTRSEIEEYCTKNNLSYVIDSTNSDTKYHRNFIRHKIIPALYQINPSFDTAINRLTGGLQNDEEFLSQSALEFIEQNNYKIAELSALHPALRARVFHIFIENISGKRGEYIHIKALEELIFRGKGEVALPNNTKACVKEGNLTQTFGKEKPIPYSFPLEEGEIMIPNLDLRLKITKLEKKFLKNEINYSFINKIAFNCDIISENLVIRSKKVGDSYHPFGRKIGKSLKKLYNEAKLPISIRDYNPIIADNNGIRWVYGFGADESAKITEETEKIIMIEKI
jgi:tRNA(Ile)-lysidine synthase